MTARPCRTPRTAAHTLRTLLAGAGVIAALAACGGDTRDPAPAGGTDTGAGLSVSTGTNDSTELAGAAVKITSTDGTITLAVLRDSVVMQLSDSVRQSVSAKVDSSTTVDAGEGMGGALASMVGGAVRAAVTSAMGVALRAPASEVSDLRYENGRLFFKVKGGNVKFIGGGSASGDGAAFAEADARRFIEAVEAAQARGPAI